MVIYGAGNIKNIDMLEQLKAAGINPNTPLVNASKGLELNSLMRMSEVIKDVLPEQKLAILSGPTLAKEVLQGKPTAACVACEDLEVAEFVQKACEKFPIPIEVFPDALYAVKEKLFELGATSAELRLAKKKDGPVITENGNLIVDAKFENVDETFETKLKNIVGVIETGLFIGYDVEVIS